MVMKMNLATDGAPMRTDEDHQKRVFNRCSSVPHRWLILLLFALTPVASGEELFGVGESSAATKPTTRESREQRVARKNPPNVVDILQHVDSADGFSAGTMTNVA